MIILGIETSCDETAAAVLQKEGDRIQILSNIVSSSLELHAKYGGIIPEQAAREQIKAIIPVITEALEVAKVRDEDLDAIAVTYGPGLIGSLLVGVETAKTLSRIWQKPLIPINHLIGHFYANWIADSPKFPCIGLLVSGGHTDLVLFSDHNTYQYLGGTRDDSAGECFDKCARMLGYAYPGGPKISKLAALGNPKAFTLPQPMSHSKDLDFSFSGLKTAFAKLLEVNFIVKKGGFNKTTSSWEQTPLIENLEEKDKQKIYDLCASLEETIVMTLLNKTVTAVQSNRIEHLIVAGGVAANQKLSTTLKLKCKQLGVKLHIPPPSLCTDNGAMIASSAFFAKEISNPLDLQADPNLSLS